MRLIEPLRTKLSTKVRTKLRGSETSHADGGSAGLQANEIEDVPEAPGNAGKLGEIDQEFVERARLRNRRGASDNDVR